MRVTPGIKFLVLSIIIAAAAFRLFNLFHIPYTYDELSALLRTRFDSFGDLIQYGVSIDGHPAGIQVLLFYYTKIVGFNEGWIKLPFILAGIASVYLTWKIGREWFSLNVGLLSAATIAFMQYTIVYSQIARPYGSGLFFTLLMLLGWSRIVLTHIGNYRSNFLLFIVGGILCEYNHHFTFLMVCLAGMTGLFLVKGKELKRYIIACAIIALAYIPHISITLNQLQMGGVEQWLNKPTLGFFVDYGKYIFNFSYVTAVAFALIIVYGVIISVVRKKIRFRKVHLVALIFGTIPAIAGYIYSVKVAALLQYSVLLFSFPMLIFLAFSFYEKISTRQTIGITIVWSLILIHSLIWTRDHYKYFYQSPYEETAKEIKAFTQTHPVDSTLVLTSFRSEVADIYKNRYGINPKLQYAFPESQQNIMELRNWLADTSYNYLIIAKSSETQPWLYALAHEYFPVSLQESNYNQGSCIVMMRGEPHYRNYLWGSKCDFSKSSSIRWLFDSASVIEDTLNSRRIIKIDSTDEYSVTWTKHTYGFIRSQANIIDATAWIYLPDSIAGEALWVASLETDTGTISWNATPISTETLPVGQWAPISVSIFLPDLKNIPFDSKVKIYICNKNRSEFYVRQAFAGIRAGNPAIYWITYGLFE
ncbi:MAG: hypothetical protein A2W93_02945 [Bacteroidetes bacterium GWF2_43_63]|nr:MAG: hypothetical protein A2W94_08945 [Bacteroidetes bacterium GWE2_42_42]OFY53622.1 MAG: hypothetical protein A2W93_02945 [Bacteroidetes bacterium GWF2_43_63]HBG71041.1 hypothetical protein [Bacteroidales bacterium]HCB63619.1 hypothetical protein [Bacteroidales bacterium]HCY24368.1 hypothetical protein [Bacteroidales bacterium]